MAVGSSPTSLIVWRTVEVELCRCIGRRCDAQVPALPNRRQVSDLKDCGTRGARIQPAEAAERAYEDSLYKSRSMRVVLTIRKYRSHNYETVGCAKSCLAVSKRKKKVARCIDPTADGGL